MISENHYILNRNLYLLDNDKNLYRDIALE